MSALHCACLHGAAGSHHADCPCFNGPTWVDGIGPPLEQIEQDARDTLNGTWTGWQKDFLLVAQALRGERAANAALTDSLAAAEATVKELERDAGASTAESAQP